MTGYGLQWNSSPEERYDTDMLARARHTIATTKVTVTGEYGGTDIQKAADPDLNGEASDNGFDVEHGNPGTVLLAAHTLETVIGKPVTVIHYGDDPDSPGLTAVPSEENT